MSNPQRLYKKGFQSLTRREKGIFLKSLQASSFQNGGLIKSLIGLQVLDAYKRPNRIQRRTQQTTKSSNQQLQR